MTSKWAREREGHTHTEIEREAKRNSQDFCTHLSYSCYADLILIKKEHTVTQSWPFPYHISFPKCFGKFRHSNLKFVDIGDFKAI